MIRRALHDKQLFTENIEEADLCFPNCNIIINHDSSSSSSSITTTQSIVLEVLPQSASKFSGCSRITIGIETPMSKCAFPVPYWHSVYSPDNNNKPSSVKSWNILAERHNLLCFTGGSWRGYRRNHVIAEMQTISKSLLLLQHNNNNNHNHQQQQLQQLFAADFVFPSQKNESSVWGTEGFFIRVWELYARSVFSWQPQGDSETRRGFYDSWMLGCIPVISQHSANTYTNLFRGHLFTTIGPKIQNVVVVLDDDVMLSGAAILERLVAIPATEIKIRQRWLKRLAPLMQWGWGEKTRSPDALLMALAAVMERSGSE